MRRIWILLSCCLLGCEKQAAPVSHSLPVQVISPDGRVPEGPALEQAEREVEPYLKSASLNQAVNLHPLFGFSGPNGFYCTACEIPAAFMEDGGWKRGDDDLGQLLDKKEGKAVPIFHLFGRGEHFYTISRPEATQACQRYGYIYLNLLGFAYPEPQSNTVPVYRFFDRGRHWYSTQKNLTGRHLEGPAFHTVKR